MKKVTLLSPFHGGSHQVWAEGYVKHSQYNVRLLTLPARFWRWRMHGAALTLAREFIALNESPDLILATDMMDLSTFLAACRKEIGQAHVALYMHENQLTYPFRSDHSPKARDHHYAFINISSMMVADRIYFATRFHRDALLQALEPFMKQFPDHNELESSHMIAEKSAVLPVAIDLDALQTPKGPKQSKTLAPLILWNHRWEHDKNPEDFFAALRIMKDENIDFRLALCGEHYRTIPASFSAAKKDFNDQLIHAGYAPRKTYENLLRQSDIVISTSHHEFFGIAIIEAIAAGALPLLPNRLSYPEIIPDAFHKHCLYSSQQALIDQLRQYLNNLPTMRKKLLGLDQHMQRFSWHSLAKHYDATLSCKRDTI